RRIELDGMASLRSLNIDGDDRRAKDLSLALAKLPELKVLDINDAKVDHLPLEKFPKLQELHLYLVTVPDEDLKKLAGLKELKKVSFGYMQNGPVALAALTDSHLSVLTMTDSEATDEGIVGIADLSGLEIFEVGGKGIGSRS